jgi:hypothetical protein
MRILAVLFSVALALMASASAGQTAIFSVPVSPGPIMVNAPSMNPPTNVHKLERGQGSNPEVDPCAGHDNPIGRSGCLGWLRASEFVLVWDWRPHCSAPDCQATAFIVIRVDGGRNQHVADAAWPLTLAGILPSKVSSPHGTCYVVSAFNNKLQAVSAPPYCLP